LECENGTDAAEREQRLLADFAEPQGRKACAAGLKRKTFLVFMPFNAIYLPLTFC
jgi:hypothetical protein